jgi:hypothetical protein
MTRQKRDRIGNKSGLPMNLQKLFRIDNEAEELALDLLRKQQSGQADRFMFAEDDLEGLIFHPQGQKK